jgi:hypothetical protein
MDPSVFRILKSVLGKAQAVTQGVLQMRQHLVKLVFLGLILAAAILWLKSFGRTEANPPPNAKVQPRKEAEKKLKAGAMLKKLNQPITLERGFDANTPLKDALEHLTDRYHLTFVIDTQAFREEGEGAEIETTPIKLQKMSNVALGTVLRLLLSQIPPSGGTYLVRNGFIEVIPASHVKAGRLLQQEVEATFDKRPLEEVLEELSDLTGASVILDSSVGDKAKTVVKAKFKNDVTLETAVRLLADMADLKAVVVGNALYVTTKAKADALRVEEEKRAKARAAEPAEEK